MTGELVPGPARSETTWIGVVLPCNGVAEMGVAASVPGGAPAEADVPVGAGVVVEPGASPPGDCAAGSEAVVAVGLDAGAASVVGIWLAHGGATPGGG